MTFHHGLRFLLGSKQSSGTEICCNLEISTCGPLKYIMVNPMLIAFFYIWEHPSKYKGLNKWRFDFRMI